jgi:DNA polymerase type B, organellar and viral
MPPRRPGVAAVPRRIDRAPPHNRYAGLGRNRQDAVNPAAPVHQFRHAARAIERRDRAQRWADAVRRLRPQRNVYFHFDEIANALNRHFVDYDITAVLPSDEYYEDLTEFLFNLYRSLRDRLQELFREHGGISFSLTVNQHYFRLGNEHETQATALHSEYYDVLTMQELDVSIRAALYEIYRQHEEYNEGASNWVQDYTADAILRVNTQQMARGVRGSGHVHRLLYGPRAAGGRSYIRLPSWVERKRCCVNPKNKDDLCFAHVMEVAVHDLRGTLFDHTERIRANTSTFLWQDLDLGIDLDNGHSIHPRHLASFERLNQCRIDGYALAITALYVDDTEHQLQVLHTSDYADEENVWRVVLLYLAKVGNDGCSVNDFHWVYVRNVPSLMRHVDGMRGHHSRVYCQRCFSTFNSQTALNHHSRLCQSRRAQHSVLPHPYAAYRNFSDVHKTRPKPAVIYADFEAFNAVIAHEPNEPVSIAKRQTKHVASGYCMHTVFSSMPEHNRTSVHRYDQPGFLYEDANSPLDPSTDVAHKFILALIEERRRIEALIDEHYKHPLHVETQHECVLADDALTHCAVCRMSLTRGIMPKWRYTLYKSRADFGDDRDFFTWRRKVRYRRLTVADQEELLEQNRRIVPAWDPTRRTHNYIGNAHYACAHGPHGIGKYGKVPVLFHNLSNYDMHLVMKALRMSDFTEIDEETGETKPAQFHAIPVAGDRFMSFSVGGLQFIDTVRFMQASLEQLVANLRKSGNGPDVFPQLYAGMPPDIVAMMTRKGEFPYEWFDHPSRFEATALPPPAQFYSTLYDASINDADYAFAQSVWDAAGCRTMADYHDLYMKQDVLLLADVFERFRALCRSENGLDPTWYVSLPGYAMDSCFKLKGIIHSNETGLEQPFCVELFSRGQTDMYEFIEQAIRGGVSMTPGRYARANHRYLPDHDPTKPDSHILYYDANNLYGDAMSQSLPTGEYHWVQRDNHRESIVAQICDKDNVVWDDSHPVGYIVEVDGHFPDHLHDRLSDFPPAPIKATVSETMISPYSRELNERFGTPHDEQSQKLLCTLGPRRKYKVHARLLHLYCKLGFVVTRVHRILAFAQEPWMKAYIDHNTRRRARATSQFEKDFYKLMNNSVYGKFIQNNRKHAEVKVVTQAEMDDPRKWNPYVRKVDDRRIINRDLVLLFLRRGMVTLNSPVAVGAAILDHSKWRMYDFYYNTMKRVYDERVRLLFTDTDSLCMEVKTADPMRDFFDRGLLPLFDLSDWPRDQSYYGTAWYDETNKKVIGKFKDEMAEKREYIVEVVALRSKMYSLLTTGQPKARLKGVKTSVQHGGLRQPGITHADYVRCLHADDDYKLDTRAIHTINSVENVLYTQQTVKRTLSPNDTKLYLLDATHTRPYGHYSLPAVPLSEPEEE